jgi:predicted small secreted protein
MKKILALVLVAALLFLSGCECISGFGRDMKKAGNWVEKKADEQK